jgi:GNAT superfamily N-acetyltransferase
MPAVSVATGVALDTWIVGDDPRHGGSSLIVRDARPEERSALEELQRRASLYEPTYRAELLAHPDAIELPVEQIEAGCVRVAERKGAHVGFAVLLAADQGACELDGLFVEPEHWRAGIGRRLIKDATEIARRRGATRIDVIANPDAVDFYLRLGFIPGQSVPTRFGPAPRMRLAVA